MNNQYNTKATPKSGKKKKMGCFGCFGTILLIIIVLVVALFAFNSIRKKMREREEEKLEARFNYELQLSSQDKLFQAFEQGEISVDAYILQLAYSVYDAEKLDPLYESDNEVDIAPNISDLFIEHIDELSDETVEYLLKKMLVLDVEIGPDASQNSTANKEKGHPFSKNVYASDYDVTVLDKAVLSPSGRFLIWYTGTGESALDDKTAQEWANNIDDISDNIEDFLDIDWVYNFDEINSDSYEDMKSVLQKCSIDENAIEEAFPIYVFEVPNKGNTLAWYTREMKGSEKFLFRIGEFMKLEETYKETGSVYSLPYIIIKPSSVSDMDSLNVLLAHELTHHFQRIYYGDLSYNAPDFTSETVANLVAASITKIKDTNSITLTNNHANQYMDAVDHFYANMTTNTTLGYLEFLWAKSYMDVVDNGKQYLKESLLEVDPFDFLYKKAGDSYQLVLEDLAVRNITKDYQEEGFVSTAYPKPKGKLNRFLDEEIDSVKPNCFNYYYLDTDTYRKGETTIYLHNDGYPSLFTKVIGRKKGNYSLIDTLYCNKDKEIMLIDFTKDDYKKYDEIILAIGNCDIIEDDFATYQLTSVSSAVIEFYTIVTGLDDYDPLKINGDCTVINVDDFVESAGSITDYLSNAITYTNKNIESDESDETEVLVDYLNHFKSEIDRIGRALEKFADVFEYKIIRVYTMPIDDTVLSDDEFHEKALAPSSKLNFKIIDKVEDDMHLTVGTDIHPFSDTQLVFTVIFTQNEGENFIYRLEFEK